MIWFVIGTVVVAVTVIPVLAAIKLSGDISRSEEQEQKIDIHK